MHNAEYRDELELLNEVQTDAELAATELGDASNGEVDRREFVFLTLAAAAARASRSMIVTAHSSVGLSRASRFR